MTGSLPRLQVGLFAREGHAGLGIDVQAPDGTPAGECLRVDYGANDDLAGAARLAFSLLGDFLPSLEAGGQAITIRHDRAGGCIILSAVPGDADDRHGGLRHV